MALPKPNIAFPPNFFDMVFNVEPIHADPRDVVGNPAPPTQKLERQVTWDDIVGLEAAKHAIKRAVVLPIKNAELYKKYKRNQPAGVLVYGPPGNGKTMLAKACATELGGLKANFRYAKGPELKDKFVGETEAKIRQLFDESRRYYKFSGTRSVIFFDEAESIMGPRDRGLVYNTLGVTTFLAEMDGVDKAYNPLVILSSNYPNEIDEAILRPGRIDRKIAVEHPSAEDVLRILRKELHGKPYSLETGQLEKIVELASSDRFALYELDYGAGNKELVCMRDDISGARAVDFVGRAFDLAIDRDIAAGATEPSGVTFVDLEQAVKDSFEEMVGLDNHRLIIAKVNKAGMPLARVRKAVYDPILREAHFEAEARMTTDGQVVKMDPKSAN